MNESEHASKIVDDAIRMLGEHFDAVQVLVSRSDGSGTGIVLRGSGNWYARQGMAHEFINADINQDAATQIADKLKGDE